ncbi:MAG: YihY/virulence factor BrkB family protein [Rhodobacteraceae bacterium]|nr:YihY/virulence factor BrkB family protein [Paracoccaceae bacterium]
MIGERGLKMAARALWDAAARFDRKGGWMMSSHIAMSMMLALFPFILFVVSLAGFLSQDVNTDNLVDLILGAWPKDVSEPIIAEIQTVVMSSSTQLMTIGGVLAIYFASNGVNAVRVAMTLAYRDEDTRPFWRARLLSLAFVLVGGALVLIAALFEVALPLYFSHVTEAVPGSWSDWFTDERLNIGLILGVPVLGVTACHLWLPGHRHALRHIWPGVALTLALWLAGTQAFALYIVRFSTYGATYAGLAGVMAALIFMYLMAAILILGAEFNGALIARRGSDI